MTTQKKKAAKKTTEKKTPGKKAEINIHEIKEYSVDKQFLHRNTLYEPDGELNTIKLNYRQAEFLKLGGFISPKETAE